MEMTESRENVRVFSELAYQELKDFFSMRYQLLTVYASFLPQWSDITALRKEMKNDMASPEELISLEGEYEQIQASVTQFLEQMRSELSQMETVLEQTYHLENTEIFRCLEACSQEACQLLTGECTDAETLYRHLQEIPDRFEYTVQNQMIVRKRRLCVAAILKNEGRYIREWVEYHRLAGVDYFEIFDNESTDGMADLLQPYVDEGIMSVTLWPGRIVRTQFSEYNSSLAQTSSDAYNEALKRHRCDTDYLMCIDGDEFVVPLLEGRNIPDCVEWILKRRDNLRFKGGFNVGGIGVNWRKFGSSGHKQRVEGLLIENYLYRADSYTDNMHIKTICNPRLVKAYYDPHYPTYQEGYCTVSQRGSYIPGGVFFDCHYDALQINHYFSKSEEELIERKNGAGL